MKKLVEQFSVLSPKELVEKFVTPGIPVIEKVTLKKVIAEKIPMTELQEMLSKRKISKAEFDLVAEVIRKNEPTAPSPAPETSEQGEEEAPVVVKTSPKEKKAPKKPAEPKVAPKEAKKEKKEKATKSGGGVLVSIMDVLSKAKTPMTTEEILAHLSKQFPERDAKGMLATIRVQIGGKKRPSRMERERGIKIEVSEKDGTNAYIIK